MMQERFMFCAAREDGGRFNFFMSFDNTASSFHDYFIVNNCLELNVQQ